MVFENLLLVGGIAADCYFLFLLGFTLEHRDDALQTLDLIVLPLLFHRKDHNLAAQVLNFLNQGVQGLHLILLVLSGWELRDLRDSSARFLLNLI